MNITVFGGSTPKPGEDSYEEALRLGSLLAKDGHTVLSGGYTGTMEAISRGAAEAGGHVIGITSEELEVWRPGGANQFVLEERSYKTMRARLYSLIESCDAALALSGGIGTLTEISVMWSQMQIDAMPARPLILIGPGWEKVFDTLLKELPSYIPEEHRPLLQFAPNVEAAVELLESALGK